MSGGRAWRGAPVAAVICLLLLLCLLATPAGAQGSGPSGPPGFDTNSVAEVYAAALAFMAPRILDPVPVPQLTVWGLHGLTALDPRIDASASESQIRLAFDGQVLRELPPPTVTDTAAWAATAADLAAAAFSVSAPMRRAGMQGVMRNFFDEVFNHLDPYSRYEPPDAATEDRESRSGDAGAGMTVAARGGAIVVTQVLGDSPAALAGLRPGDRVLSVDGQGTRGRTAAAVAEWLAGADGTALTIAWRGRGGHTHSADLVRALVPPETVFPQRVGDVLLLRVTGFNHSTSSHLAASVRTALAMAHAPAGLVIDLRGNRGGLLLEAVAAADLFLDGGPIASTAGRDPQAAHAFEASVKADPITLPIVVLVDGRTASSAEILAAVLADRGRAVVVGSSTFGKGLVQTVTTLPDGGELFVTWSRVIAPLGWPLQGLGVMPQVCTSSGQAEVAQELAALSQGTPPMARAVATERGSRAPVPAAQAVAIRSACPAAEGREDDTTVARWLIDHPGGYVTALLPPMR